jgi:hypothetical protein
MARYSWQACRPATAEGWEHSSVPVARLAVNIEGMARQRDRTNVYILLLAILVAAIAGYYLPTKRPESGTSLTPKEYIELVEKKKAQRLKYSAEDAANEPAAAAERKDQRTGSD